MNWGGLRFPSNCGEAFLDLDVKDGLEISVQDNCIILRKAETADIFNGSTEDLVEFEGRKVSENLSADLLRLLV